MNSTIKLPYNFVPRGYQRPFWNAMKGKKRAVLVWHRRSGKDLTVLNYMIKEMVKRVGTYHYVFPEFNQGRKVLWDGIDKAGVPFMDHFPKELVISKHDQEMQLTIKNGSIFQIIGSDKMDNLVGTNPIGIAFSEYPIQKPTVWDFYRPILAENGGWAVFDFTPRGMNHGWKILQQARQDQEHWFFQVLTVEDTKVISHEILDQEQKEMPQALFKQEYYCEFLEGAGSFFRRVTENIKEDLGSHVNHQFQLGVDLAKYHDWTVITPFCLNCFQVLQQDRFNQVDWNLQKSRIQTAAYKYNNARVVVDATGVGDPIAEDLARSGLNVEPFKFTETSRRQLLDNLSVLIEQNKVGITPDDGLVSELQSMMFTLTETGKTKVAVAEGLTDDRIMSMGLAVWQISSPLKEPKNSEFKIYEQEFA